MDLDVNDAGDFKTLYLIGFLFHCLNNSISVLTDMHV